MKNQVTRLFLGWLVSANAYAGYCDLVPRAPGCANQPHAIDQIQRRIVKPVEDAAADLVKAGTNPLVGVLSLGDRESYGGVSGAYAGVGGAASFEGARFGDDVHFFCGSAVVAAPGAKAFAETYHKRLAPACSPQTYESGSLGIVYSPTGAVSFGYHVGVDNAKMLDGFDGILKATRAYYAETVDDAKDAVTEDARRAKRLARIVFMRGRIKEAMRARPDQFPQATTEFVASAIERLLGSFYQAAGLGAFTLEAALKDPALGGQARAAIDAVTDGRPFSLKSMVARITEVVGKGSDEGKLLSAIENVMTDCDALSEGIGAAPGALALSYENNVKLPDRISLRKADTLKNAQALARLHRLIEPTGSYQRECTLKGMMPACDLLRRHKGPEVTLLLGGLTIAACDRLR